MIDRILPLFVKSLIAHKVFNLSTASLSRSSCFGILVHYKNEDFLQFVESSISELKNNDPLGFSRLRSNIRNIVQFERDDLWVGRSIAVYFDKYSDSQRLRMGHRRYAAHMVRVATEVRLLHQFKVKDILRFQSPRYNRALSIAVRRELFCCKKLGCEMREIYNIQRWLRNA